MIFQILPALTSRQKGGNSKNSGRFGRLKNLPGKLLSLAFFEDIRQVTFLPMLCYLCTPPFKPDIRQLSSKTFLSQSSKTATSLDPDLSELKLLEINPRSLKVLEQKMESSVNPYHKNVEKYQKGICISKKVLHSCMKKQE